MTHMYMRHDSLVTGTATYAHLTWYIYERHDTYIFICDMTHFLEAPQRTDDARGHGAADVSCDVSCDVSWVEHRSCDWVMFFVTESCLTWKCDLQLIDRGGRDDARGHVAGTTRHPAHMNESCRMRMSHVSCEESCTIDTHRWYGWCERPSCRWREAFRWCNLFFQLLLPISVRCTSSNA